MPGQLFAQHDEQSQHARTAVCAEVFNTQVNPGDVCAEVSFPQVNPRDVCAEVSSPQGNPRDVCAEVSPINLRELYAQRSLL